MTLPSDTSLALISWLATRDTPALESLVRRREIAPSECTSFRTLANALLQPENIHHALRNLSRQELLALRNPTQAATVERETLEEWGLLAAPPEGPALLIPESSLDILGAVQEGAPPAMDHAVVELSDSEAGAAASRGLSAVVSVSDLLDACAHSRLPATADGNPTATSLKTLQSQLGPGYDLPFLFHHSQQAGLLGVHHQRVALTSQALAWRELPDDTRYQHIVEAWWAGAPGWLSSVMTERPAQTWDTTLVEYVGYHYPLIECEPILSELRRDAESMGLLQGSTPTAWARELWSGGDVAAALRGWFPPYAPGVFAHDDYTLLASGPLKPEHRDILARLATRELGGLVPRYRLTAASILDALQEGVSDSEIPTLLESVCVNEVPAGMIALSNDVARRALELELHHRGESTVLVTGREELATELLCDPGLIVLGLKRQGDRELVCSWPAERVHSTLLAASYPSIVVDPSGRPLEWTPELATEDSSKDQENHHSVLAGLVRDAQDAAERGVPAGFSSIIEVATETKTPLEIVVRMPDGSPVTVVMEPRALSAGRLRGVELKHAVEKTLPVSHITSVKAWIEDAD